jgi:hypothetical protein
MAGLGKGVISASSAQFPFLTVSVAMEQRALLDAYVRAFAVDPVTTRPATSIAPEPTSVPLGCKLSANGAAPFGILIQIWPLASCTT